MMRRIRWLVTICVVVWLVFAIQDRRQRARRRELWAEATD